MSPAVIPVTPQSVTTERNAPPGSIAAPRSITVDSARTPSCSTRRTATGASRAAQHPVAVRVQPLEQRRPGDPAGVPGERQLEPVLARREVLDQVAAERAQARALAGRRGADDEHVVAEQVIAPAADQQVVAGAALEPVAALAADQDVVAAPAHEHVGTPQPAQPVRPVVADDQVRLLAAVDPLDRDQRVGAGARGEIDADAGRGEDVARPVGPQTTVEPVAVGLRVEPIVAVAAEQRVLPRTAEQPVLASTAEQRIVAVLAPQPVVAAQARDHVVAARPADLVGLARAGEAVVGLGEQDHGHRRVSVAGGATITP